MPINIFISDNAPVPKKGEKTIPPTFEFGTPSEDDVYDYTTPLEFEFTAPGSDPSKYAVQVISYHETGEMPPYSYTYHGEITGGNLEVSDDPVLTSPTAHHTFGGESAFDIGDDPYVLLVLARVDGTKRRVRATRHLTA